MALANSNPINLIDAFFWIEPTRNDLNSPFQGTKVLWHYPEDVSFISKQFKDIPQFCFPDLNGMKLEKPGEVLSDQYIFTLTDKEGSRYYGICYRNFFRGISRRYDISRRNKHCICIISRFPYFAFFRVLLMDIFSSGLLEHSRGVCKTFVYQMLNRMESEFSQNGNMIIPIAQLLPFPLENIPSLSINPELKYQIPKQSKLNLRDISILPIFSILGVDRFFKVLAAILCEQRILFISNDVDLLTSTILASIAMIYPFRWHHVFITLLPPKLVSYLAAPVPYIIGVRRSVLAEVDRGLASGVMLVDLDNAEVGANGNVVQLDLIGDSGTALRQATESFDRVRMGVTSMFYGKTATTDEAIAQKELMPILVLDLKSALSAKPSSSALSGLLRGLPGTSKTYEEAKAQWQIESEKVLRDSLACFFVYLFADLDDFWIGNQAEAMRSASSSKSSSDFSFNPRDFRAKFDLKAFVQRKLQNGLSKLLQEFLAEFFHSQMFERFCEEKCNQRAAPAPSASQQRYTRATSTASVSSTASTDSALTQDVDDLFEAACAELRYRQQPVNAVNAKAAVSSRSTLHLGDGNAAFSGGGKINMAGFHSWTLQYTAASDSENIFEVELFDDYIGNYNHRTPYNHNQSTILERILTDLYQSDLVKKIFVTITFRLEALKASSCRGSTALSGIKALQLLAILLVQGPAATLPLGLELIPLLRSLLKLNKSLMKSSGGGFGALDFVNGQYVSPRSAALVVLGLLTDHRRLLIQKSVHLLALNDPNNPLNSSNHATGKAPLHRKASASNATAPSSTAATGKKDLFVAGASHTSKNFPSFKSIHAKFNEMGRSSIRGDILRLTVPEKALNVEEEDEGDQMKNFERAESNVSNNPAPSAGGKITEDLLEFEEPVVPVPPKPATAVTTNPSNPMKDTSAKVSLPPPPLARANSPKRLVSDPPASSNSNNNRGTSPVRSDSEKRSPPINPFAPPPSSTPAATLAAPLSLPPTSASNQAADNEDRFRLKNLDTGATTSTSLKLKPPPNDVIVQGKRNISPKTSNPNNANPITTSTSSTSSNNVNPFNDDFFGLAAAAPPAVAPAVTNQSLASKSSDPFGSFASDWPPVTGSSSSTAPSSSVFPSTDPFAAFGSSAFPPAAPVAAPAKATDPFALPAFSSAADPFASFPGNQQSNKSTTLASNSFDAFQDFPPSNPRPVAPQPPVFIATQAPPGGGLRPPPTASAKKEKDPFADLMNFK